MVTPDPLVTHIYTADPSAHVFNGKLYGKDLTNTDSIPPSKSSREDGSAKTCAL